MIRKRRLGRTNLEVTEIGLGGIPIIGIPRERAVKIINRALDLGINYIDTARAYRDSESKIGEVMKYRRDECFLATKSGAGTKEEILRDIDTSLRELQTDYIDIMQLHDVSTEPKYRQVMGRGGALEGVREAQRKGKVRFVGFSSHNIAVMEKMIPTGEFDTVLLVYNLAIHDTGDTVIPLAKEHDVGVVVMKPLSGGTLMRLTKGKGDKEITPEIAWRFVLENPDISCALAGAQWLKDVEQAVRVSRRFKPLSPEEKEKYIRIAQELGESTCQDCRYCADCPVGIDIPTIMQLLDRSRAFPYEWPKYRTIYRRLEKDVEDCIDCGVCEQKCPFNLPIRERLRKAKERFDKEV